MYPETNEVTVHGAKLSAALTFLLPPKFYCIRDAVIVFKTPIHVLCSLPSESSGSSS